MVRKNAEQSTKLRTTKLKPRQYRNYQTNKLILHSLNDIIKDQLASLSDESKYYNNLELSNCQFHLNSLMCILNSCDSEHESNA